MPSSLFIIEMPVNAEGLGPEMNSNLVTHIYWEVWDQDFNTVAVFNTKTEAQEYLKNINK